MNTSRCLIPSITALQALIIVLMLAAGPVLAQNKTPEETMDTPLVQEQLSEKSTDTEPIIQAGPVRSIISIQGRLTTPSGTPINGLRTIVFTFYDESYDGEAKCQDSDDVDVINGIFNADIDYCTSSDVGGQQLYLGVKVEDDAEMTPRLPVRPVPYSYSLRPGAIIMGDTSVAILHVENTHPSGRGVRAYAMSETGTNYGIIGASRSPEGYGGYFYNNGDGTALYGKAVSETGVVYGIHGMSEADQGRGVYGEGMNVAGGIGVEGKSNIGTGVYGNSDNGLGVYGSTGNSSGNYGLYTGDNIYSRNFHTLGATMQVVQNGGSTSLEPGDVAAFSGMGTSTDTGAMPTIQVVAATSADSTAVAGVVYSRYNIEAIAENGEGMATQSMSDLDITPEGQVEPGEYLLMVVRGPAQVKASALSESIRPGDLLSSAGIAGHAARATQLDLGNVQTAMPGTVVGKALESLDSKKELIYVFVTLQ